MMHFIEMILNLYIEQINPKDIMAIVETEFDMCTLEKCKNQKVTIPANSSNTSVFETLEQNISLTCISYITLLNPLFIFNRKESNWS